MSVEGVYVGTYYTNQHIIQMPTLTVGIKATSDIMTYKKNNTQECNVISSAGTIAFVLKSYADS